MNNLVTLRSKKDENCVEQSDERPGSYPFEEHVVIPRGADENAECKTCDDGGGEWYPEENSNACCDDGIGYDNCGIGVADDFNEEDSKGCVEDNL